MVNASVTYEPVISSSGELSFYADTASEILHCKFGNIQRAGIAEFLSVISAMGESMRHEKIGKMCMDISSLSHFDIPSRVAVVKNLPAIFLDKIPFLVLAVVKGPSLFENMTMQLAIAATMPLSKKFLDSKLFDTPEQANQWLRTDNTASYKSI
jgi:hypothetical protein